MGGYSAGSSPRHMMSCCIISRRQLAPPRRGSARPGQAAELDGGRAYWQRGAPPSPLGRRRGAKMLGVFALHRKKIMGSLTQKNGRTPPSRWRPTARFLPRRHRPGLLMRAPAWPLRVRDVRARPHRGAALWSAVGSVRASISAITAARRASRSSSSPSCTCPAAARARAISSRIQLCQPPSVRTYLLCMLSY